ncbi:hypothetical protein FRC12_009327 [Ceratobasidium sp. 428]|nr:hypothetical protein FRC12_009327 [Ceratobasidium sp. 428]
MRALSDSLDDASPETIEMLKTVLVPVLKTNNTPKHCVRCHQTYRESSNKLNSCVINHTKPREDRRRDPDGRKYYHMLLEQRFDCCGKFNREYYEDWDANVFVRSDDEDDEDDEEPNYGVCLTAKHTTDPTAVQYFSTRAEKKAQEKGIDYSGRNENVRTCKMTGCESNKQPKRKK